MTPTFSRRTRPSLDALSRLNSAKRSFKEGPVTDSRAERVVLVLKLVDLIEVFLDEP